MELKQGTSQLTTQSIETIVTGFKATDANIQCRGFQFVFGEWHEIEGEIKLCEHGFHFCEQPSGPWCYYSEAGTRIWKVEAQGVLNVPREPGAAFKLVARRIRLVEEVTIGGDSNTGHSNTGDRNTGSWNTGHSNTGDRNTGHRNTGDSNTGHRNTGSWNTGDRNTGDSNTGDRNTGHRNTGSWNTGSWNATNYSAGFFCQQEPTVLSFDIDSGLSRADFSSRFGGLCYRLGDLLMADDPIDFGKFAAIPGITPEKLTSLHAKFIAARKAVKH